MMEFRTLGGVELRGAAGETLHSLAAQPRRVALLAYLCLATPRGFHRRDTLLALFWPDSDQAHARTALRNAIHFLRRALGADTVTARGDDELSIDSRYLWCDAVAFDTAVEGGRAEEAVPLYRGDFLAGFFIREAPEWERWLEGERARLRSHAARMARKMAECNETERNITGAVSWARRAVELTGDDERAFRRLLELFERVDDRAGALHAYDAFARRLRAEYATEPAAETRALAARIREKPRAPAEAHVSLPAPAALPTASDALPAVPAALPIIPGYLLERELTRGEIANVYLARDLRHDRSVVIKMLRSELAATLATARFLAEIQVAAHVRHPHILPLYDSGAIAGVPYFVMPVAGDSLRARLRRDGTIPVTDAIRILRGVASALALAHRRGIIHCDVKPENILLEEGDSVLADFGVARAVAASTTDIPHSSTGIALGSPGYMAPEQLCASPHLDARADVYSLGVVAHEMLTGALPFAAGSAQEMVAAQLRSPARSISELRPDVPLWLAGIVAKALAIDPGARYQDGGELLAALETEQKTGGRAHSLAPRQRLLRIARSPIGIVVAVAFLVGTAAAVSHARNEDVPRRVSAYRIAVFPFRVLGDTGWTFLHEGSMDLLSGALDGVGELRRVDPVAVTSRMRREGISEVEPNLARRISSELGAGRYVLGTVVGEGDRASISASLYDAEGDAEPLATAQAATKRDSLSHRFMGLARDLLQDQQVGEGGRLSHIGSVRAQSFAAEKAYFSGEAMLRRGVYDSAGLMYEQAVRADSTFALAWYRLSLVRSIGATGPVMESIDAAMRHRARLARRDRLLVESREALLRGNGKSAEDRALAAVTAYPDEVEAWSALGAARWWYAWQLGRSPVGARPALERALTLDPNYRASLHMLHILSMYERRYAEANALARRAYSPQGPLAFNLTSARAVSAFAGDDTAAQRGVVAELGGARELVIFQSAAFVASYTDNLAGARRIAELMIESSTRSRAARARGHVVLGLIEIARGARDSARWEFARAAALDAPLALTYQGIVAAVPQFGFERDEVRAIREAVLRWRPTKRARMNLLWLATPDELGPHIRDYLLGLLAAKLGDDKTALEYADALAAADDPDDRARLLPDLALEIRAFVSAHSGDSSASLATLAKAHLGVRQEFQVAAPLYERPVGRFLRAEMLHSLGRDADALGWYASLTSLSMTEFVFLAPAYLRMGEIYEKAGNSAAAVEYYSRFVARWQHCDSALRPLVADARRRIARLANGPYFRSGPGL